MNKSPEEWPAWMYDVKPFARAIPMSIIKQACAEAFEVPVDAVKSKRRSKEFVAPRQAAMALSATMTRKSLNQIGRSFDLDHTTIMYGHKVVRDRLDNDAEFLVSFKRARRLAIEGAMESATIDELAGLLMEEIGKKVRAEIKQNPTAVLARILNMKEDVM